MNITEFVSQIRDVAKEHYKKYPDKSPEWDNFHKVELNADEALKFLFYKDTNTNSGYLLDEGPSERLYNCFEEDGETLTSWGKSLFDSHVKDGYRKGISNHVHVGINVEELNNVSKIGDVIKYYPEFTLALLNYHRRRSFYDQYPFEELEEKYPNLSFIPNEPITFSFYLWKPSIDGKVKQYQDLYDLFDAAVSVDNAKSKIQGVLNLSGLKNYLKTDFFVKGNFTSAIKHLWEVWSDETYDIHDAISDFREEILWLDSLSLNNIFSKKNPHCACYFEAFALAAKKYGGKNQYLKRVLKSIESTFAKVNEDPYAFWCKVFDISITDLVKQNRKSVLVDKRFFATSVRTGSEWLALESRGLHIFNGKDYQYTNDAADELVNLTNQQGRSYQRSTVSNQQEKYVSLILGYVYKMMDASDPSEVMRQIPSNDREYLGDLPHNVGRDMSDQKYSVMKNTVDELTKQVTVV